MIGSSTALHDLLVGRDLRRSVWLNAGVETASGELLKRSGRGGNRRGQSEPWGDFLHGQLRRLCRRVLRHGQLDDRAARRAQEHVRETLAWVQSLSRERMAVFPVLYAAAG